MSHTYLSHHSLNSNQRNWRHTTYCNFKTDGISDTAVHKQTRLLLKADPEFWITLDWTSSHFESVAVAQSHQQVLW